MWHCAAACWSSRHHQIANGNAAFGLVGGECGGHFVIAGLRAEMEL